MLLHQVDHVAFALPTNKYTFEKRENFAIIIYPHRIKENHSLSEYAKNQFLIKKNPKEKPNQWGMEETKQKNRKLWSFVGRVSWRRSGGGNGNGIIFFALFQQFLERWIISHHYSQVLCCFLSLSFVEYSTAHTRTDFYQIYTISASLWFFLQDQTHANSLILFSLYLE